MMRLANDFDSVYEKYKDKIHKHVLKILKYNDIDDVVQEILIKIEKGLASFRGESTLSTWIHKITVNHCIDHLRKTKTNNILREIRNQQEFTPTSQREFSDVENDLIQKEMKECIRGYIMQLPAIYQDVVLLSDIEQLTSKEVADTIGVSLEAAKIRIHRGHSKLKNILSERCCLYYSENNELACDKK